jgi:DNA-binding transcriptional regulator GbsR (MarR family)
VTDCREKRVKLYSAKDDTLSVVATVFRKREQHSIEEFKKMLVRVSEQSEMEDQSKLTKRIESMLYTCQLAEAVMNMVIAVAQVDQTKRSGHLAKKLPQVIELLSSGVEPLSHITQTVKNNLTEKFKSSIGKITGDNNDEQ